jgi:hypothetical protein
MALQIRRGLEADLPASPADGELLYATDTNKLYVGDGGTAQEISGGSGLGNVIEDTTPQLGGALDVNGFSVVSTNNENINISNNSIKFGCKIKRKIDHTYSRNFLLVFFLCCEINSIILIVERPIDSILLIVLRNKCNQFILVINHEHLTHIFNAKRFICSFS